MVEVTFLADSYLFLANVLFLLSYMQKELLMLRLVLISAILFTSFMGLRYPTVFLDVQIFNLVFIFLNGYLSFKLIKKLIPPKFANEERRLYNKYFSRYFKPNEFRKLVDIARRKVYRVNSNVINQGNGFYSLFFIADITDENIKVELKMNGTVIKEISKHGWVGIVEYTEVISQQTLSQGIERGSDFGNWGVNLEVKFNIEEENSIEESLEAEEVLEFPNISLISKIPREVIIYEFDLESLNRLFKDKDDGNSIKNGLHSIWLLYFSEYIYKFESSKKQHLQESLNISHRKRTGSVLLSENDLSL